jgi:hypothetical protein
MPAARPRRASLVTRPARFSYRAYRRRRRRRTLNGAVRERQSVDVIRCWATDRCELGCGNLGTPNSIAIAAEAAACGPGCVACQADDGSLPVSSATIRLRSSSSSSSRSCAFGRFSTRAAIARSRANRSQSRMRWGDFRCPMAPNAARSRGAGDGWSGGGPPSGGTIAPPTESPVRAPCRYGSELEGRPRGSRTLAASRKRPSVTTGPVLAPRFFELPLAHLARHRDRRV